MAQNLAQLPCPNCRNPIRAPVQQIFDLAQDPSAKARLLAGNTNFVRCPVCGYEGQLAAPIVYHDPEKELLLTYMPMEVGLPKDDQERALGQLINNVVNALPPEMRKGYLLQPQPVLSLQGMVDRILEADGISKEDVEEQREKLRLLEEMLQMPEENLSDFVKSQDEDLDETFFQLAAVAIQSMGDENARRAATQILEKAIAHSTYGKEIQETEAEFRSAAESLRSLGDEITREKLVDLLIEAPTAKRVEALANLTRPALDYQFYTLLSNQIEAAEGEEKERREELRTNLLKITEEIDRRQEERAAQSSALLQSLLEAEDLDAAFRAVLPMIDDLFVAILQANLQAAKEKGDATTLSRLEEVERRLQEHLTASLPPGIQLAQKLVEMEDEDQAFAQLEAAAESIDEELLGALLATSQRLNQAGEVEDSERLRRLHRQAIRLSMRRQMSQSA